MVLFEFYNKGILKIMVLYIVLLVIVASAAASPVTEDGNFQCDNNKQHCFKGDNLGKQKWNSRFVDEHHFINIKFKKYHKTITLLYRGGFRPRHSWLVTYKNLDKLQ